MGDGGGEAADIMRYRNFPVPLAAHTVQVGIMVVLMKLPLGKLIIAHATAVNLEVKPSGGMGPAGKKRRRLGRRGEGWEEEAKAGKGAVAGGVPPP